MADVEGHYNHGNRLFLQTFLGKGVLTLKDAKPILAGIFTIQEGIETLPADVTEADLVSYISAANDAISPFDFAIRSMHSEIDGTRIWALVNTTSDQMTQLATTHTADEISYLKRLLDAMFETFNTPRQEVMAITEMQAVRLGKNPADSQANHTENGSATQGSGGKGLSMKEAEATLKGFVDEGWFEKSKSGFYTLSPRALLELQQYLKSTYNGPADDEEVEEGEERIVRIRDCYACKEMITIGQRCVTRQCDVRVHDMCIEKFFRVVKGKFCPSCKKPWDGEHYVGERAVTTTEAWLKGRRRSNTAPRTSTARRSARSSTIQSATVEGDDTVESATILSAGEDEQEDEDDDDE